jgi:hypothetical protein
VQQLAFKFINTQALEFGVIFKDDTIYIEQNNMLFIKLTPNNTSRFLCLQG